MLKGSPLRVTHFANDCFNILKFIMHAVLPTPDCMQINFHDSIFQEPVNQ